MIPYVAISVCVFISMAGLVRAEDVSALSSQPEHSLEQVPALSEKVERGTPPARSFFDTCLLAAKGMGAGFFSFSCGACVATFSYRDFTSNFKQRPPTIEPFNKTWAGIVSLSFAVALAALAYTAGGYSLSTFKELLKGKKQR